MASINTTIENFITATNLPFKERNISYKFHRPTGLSFEKLIFEVQHGTLYSYRIVYTSNNKLQVEYKDTLSDTYATVHIKSNVTETEVTDFVYDCFRLSVVLDTIIIYGNSSKIKTMYAGNVKSCVVFCGEKPLEATKVYSTKTGTLYNKNNVLYYNYSNSIIRAVNLITANMIDAIIDSITGKDITTSEFVLYKLEKSIKAIKIPDVTKYLQCLSDTMQVKNEAKLNERKEQYLKAIKEYTEKINTAENNLKNLKTVEVQNYLELINMPIISNVMVSSNKNLLVIFNPIICEYKDLLYKWDNITVEIDFNEGYIKTVAYTNAEGDFIHGSGGFNHYPHPHINMSGSFCFGSEQLKYENFQKGCLSIFDMLYTIYNVLTTYNDKSPYQPIQTYKKNIYKVKPLNEAITEKEAVTTVVDTSTTTETVNTSTTTSVVVGSVIMHDIIPTSEDEILRLLSE